MNLYRMLGLHSDVVATIKRDLRAGEVLDGKGGRVRWKDVEYNQDDLAVRTQREMEAAFKRPNLAP